MLPMQKSQQSIVMLAAAVAPTHRGSICIPSGVELHSTVLAAQPRLIEHLYFNCLNLQQKDRYGICLLNAMIKENIDGTFASESVNLCQTKCEIALDLWKLPQMHRYNLKILRQEISTRFFLTYCPFP